MMFVRTVLPILIVLGILAVLTAPFWAPKLAKLLRTLKASLTEAGDTLANFDKEETTESKENSDEL